MSEDKSDTLGTCELGKIDMASKGHADPHRNYGCPGWAPLPSSEGTTLDPQINPCACVCHKVGLFGLMCCPCSMKALDELVNGKATKPQAPSVPLKSETVPTEPRTRSGRGNAALDFEGEIEWIKELDAKSAKKETPPMNSESETVEERAGTK